VFKSTAPERQLKEGLHSMWPTVNTSQILLSSVTGFNPSQVDFIIGKQDIIFNLVLLKTSIKLLTTADSINKIQRFLFHLVDVLFTHKKNCEVTRCEVFKVNFCKNDIVYSMALTTNFPQTFLTSYFDFCT
jgi:hypothetical protein